MTEIVSKDQRDATFKQRRLLFTLTFILAAIHGVDMKLGDSVQMQGLVLEIGNLHTVIVALWIAWVYAYYRYCLYYRALPRAEIEKARERLRVEHSVRIGRPGVLNALGKLMEGAPGVADLKNVKVVAQSGSKLQQSSTGDAFVKGCYARSVDPATADFVGGSIDVTVILTAEQLRKVKRAAAAEFLALNPYVTDFVTPLWIAWLAPVAGAFDLTRYLLS